jgi:ribonuclease HI
MAAGSRIWVEAAHHGAFRVGGWAVVRVSGGEVRGSAGGARRIDVERTSLMAFAAALAEAPAGAVVALNTASPLVLAIPGRVAAAEAGGDAPTENLDLWAQAATALRRVRLVASLVERAPGGPAAFSAAWADFALERAKDKGPFTAVIPKSNLAKAGVPAAPFLP